MAQLQNVGTWAECYVLVFTNGTELSLAGIAADDRDAIKAEALDKGWRYAGSIAVDHAGEPNVCIEPGCAATMTYAGLVFAEMMLGRMKGQQLEGKR